MNLKKSFQFSLCSCLLLIAGSNIVKASDGSTTIFSSDFDKSGVTGWTVIDSNKDGITWKTKIKNGKNVASVSFSDIVMDDWLITPAVSLEGGNVYNLTFEASGSKFWPERLEIKFGKSNTVDGMTSIALEPIDIECDDLEQFATTLTVDSDGVYYIGFHGISDPDMFNLCLDKVVLEGGKSVTAPAPVSNLKVQADPNAGLSCDISFIAPALQIDGSALSEISGIDLYRNDVLIHSFNQAQSGMEYSYTDRPEKGGIYTYSVIVKNKAGESDTAMVDVLIGFDLPQSLGSVKVAYTDIDGVVTVSWPAVTKDIKGRTLTSGDVSYAIYLQNDEGEWVIAEDNVDETSHTFRLVEEGEQKLAQVMVYPFTTAGRGDGNISELMPIGTPYESLHESFADESISYVWSLRATNEGSMDVFDDTYSMVGHRSQDADNGYLRVYTPYFDSTVDFFTGLVSLSQTYPTLSFYTLNLGTNGYDDTNTIAVAIKERNASEWTTIMAPKPVFEICDKKPMQWGRCIVPLDEYAGKTVQIMFSVIGNKYVDTMIDNILITNVLATDLAIALSEGPAVVKTGENYKMTFKVENVGALTASSYKVKLIQDGKIIEESSSSDLLRDKSEFFDFELKMSPFAEEPEIYAISVEVDDDEDKENNTVEISVKPLASTLPVITNVKGSINEGKVSIQWERPSLETMSAPIINESFEEAVGFDSSYPDWTFVDLDGNPVFTEEDLPGIRSYIDTGSWWVWNNEVIDWNMPVHDANTGEKYLFAAASRSKASDNWAISPELSGESQIISFFAQSRMWTYPEAFSVYWSEGSLDPADFKLLDKSNVSPVPPAWTEFLYRLPEGAKRFAIRSYADDAWALLIDDVTFQAVSPSEFLVEGYNVYRDGKLLNESPLKTTSFTDSETADDETVYQVTVVYESRGESLPAVATIDNAGIDSVIQSPVDIKVKDREIVISGAEGIEVTVVRVDGASIYAGKGYADMKLHVAPAVYIVKAGKETSKVIVR